MSRGEHANLMDKMEMLRAQNQHLKERIQVQKRNDKYRNSSISNLPMMRNRHSTTFSGCCQPSTTEQRMYKNDLKQGLLPNRSLSSCRDRPTLACESHWLRSLAQQLNNVRQYAADEQMRLASIIDQKNQRIEDLLSRQTRLQSDYRNEVEKINDFEKLVVRLSKNTVSAVPD